MIDIVKYVEVGSWYIDFLLQKGRFGWFDIDNVYLPYIFRYTNDQFTSVREVAVLLALYVLYCTLKTCNFLKVNSRQIDCEMII